MPAVDDQRWKLVVVLASYNEANSIVPVLAELKEASVTLALTHVEMHVVLVDDSSDDTADRATTAAAAYDLSFEVVIGPSDGLGRAMLVGMRAALAHDPDSIVTLDADGQHNPVFIPTLHRAFAARSDDLVIGSRWTRGGSSPGTSLLRTTGSRLGNRVFRAVTGTRGVRDATTSFRVYSPRLVRFLLQSHTDEHGGYSFFSASVALAEAAGFGISEVPITFRPRYSGTSKFNRDEAVAFFTALPALRRERRDVDAIDPNLEYLAGDELGLLAKAVRWNRLLLDETIRGADDARIDTVLEVGCGYGSIVAAARTRFPEAVVVGIEPDDANFAIVAQRFAGDERVVLRHETLEAHLADPDHHDAYDLVLFVNVLEHIADDSAELVRAAAACRPGGWVGALVPASPSLYGPIDFKSGHFRRYEADDLRAKFESAGLDVVRTHFLDVAGLVPYWVNYRLLNKSGISSGGLWAFENILVPVTRFCSTAVPSIPFGKNLVLLARRGEPTVG